MAASRRGQARSEEIKQIKTVSSASSLLVKVAVLYLVWLRLFRHSSVGNRGSVKDKKPVLVKNGPNPSESLS